MERMDEWGEEKKMEAAGGWGKKVRWREGGGRGAAQKTGGTQTRGGVGWSCAASSEGWWRREDIDWRAVAACSLLLQRPR
ncbi:hypothetical protein CDAR_281821 [Caerostris darwini]|uniref:Uncharacterized protein n=1 Tax=Caerostris darwini TaxID=1538125 RepID=A0AAV4WT96_9ARAC|nr:hypothetical protein CDAR_281821 [Caerostris darwini]